MEWIPTNHGYALTTAPILLTCDIPLQPYVNGSGSWITWEWFVNNMGVVREWRVTYRSNPMSIVVKRFNCATSFVLQNVLYMCATSNNHFHCIHLWQDWHSTSLVLPCYSRTTPMLFTNHSHWQVVFIRDISLALYINRPHVIRLCHLIRSTARSPCVPLVRTTPMLFTCAISSTICYSRTTPMLITNHSHVIHEPLPCYSRTTPMLFTCAISSPPCVNRSQMIHLCHLIRSTARPTYVPLVTTTPMLFICNVSLPPYINRVRIWFICATLYQSRPHMIHLRHPISIASSYDSFVPPYVNRPHILHL